MTVQRYHSWNSEDDEDGHYVAYDDYSALMKERDALVVESAAVKAKAKELVSEASLIYSKYNDTQMPDRDLVDMQTLQEMHDLIRGTPEAALAEIRNEARAEGIYFTANRMLAAWDAGFIDSPNKEVIDVARMILDAADALKDASDGDFNRAFSDEMIEVLKEQLRKESGK